MKPELRYTIRQSWTYQDRQQYRYEDSAPTLERAKALADEVRRIPSLEAEIEVYDEETGDVVYSI